MENLNLSNLWNNVFKGLIILLWIYLYNTESITINRIIIFIIVFGLVAVYSRFIYYIDYIFKKNYIKNNEKRFYKILDILLIWQKWHNPLIPFLTYTDKCLFYLNRYITGTKLLRYNFAIYVIVKYILMFGFIKLILYKYYRLWDKFYNLTIIDILFKRMYGLILSVLIFTDIFNNILLYVSNYGYGIWSYIIIYYIISILCIIWELIFFNIPLKYLGFIINKLKLYGLVYSYFARYTKMNIIISYRNEYTWVGRIIFNIISILIPEKKTFHEEWMSVEEFSKGRGIMSGRIAYFKPLEKTLSFEYHQYFGGFMDRWFMTPTFNFFYESYKTDLSYEEFFKLKYERKDKPSQFLLFKLLKLASLYSIYNQPIGKLMDWTYFESKANELFNLFNDSEVLIVNNKLLYLKNVDDLRAKLMYYIIWDIESFYQNKSVDYGWNYWIIQYHSILEELTLQIDSNIFQNMDWKYNNNLLKFYDPEENMEYFNRLFNVLGMVGIGNMEIIDNYYVSLKFNNYNKNYVDLVKIMYKYDCKRWEEPHCDCNYLSLYEIEISYKIEDYLQTLRKEWEDGLKVEKLEERNWRLLKELEELMDKD
jgi:hypothetical protein